MSTVKKKQPRAAQTEVTVGEFKQWLSGVEDMQPSDWTPDASQWKKIREKIKLLTESEVVEVQVPAPQPPQQLHHHVPYYEPQPQQFFEPMNAPSVHHRPHTPTQSSLITPQQGEIDYSVPGTTSFS